MNKFAQAKALAEIRKRGMGLPGHVVSVNGSIVTVSFDVDSDGVTLPQVTMPLFGPEYIRYPIQEGNEGTAIPATVSLGGVSGLGPANPALYALQGNLSTLLWMPVANIDWVAVVQDALTMYGPVGGNGVLIEDNVAAPNFSIAVTKTGITLTGAGHTVLLNSTGLVIDGIKFETHGHQPGTYNIDGTPVTGEAGPPQAGPA